MDKEKQGQGQGAEQMTEFDDGVGRAVYGESRQIVQDQQQAGNGQNQQQATRSRPRGSARSPGRPTTHQTTAAYVPSRSRAAADQ